MLHGRAAERTVLDRLIDDLGNARSGVQVIRGEPGCGKTALLQYAAERTSDGPLVLRATGVRSESELAFAGLHQLLRGTLGHLDALPEMQASALRGALRIAPGTSSDRFLVSIAVLSLLTEAAAERGLVCLVDDAHWLDPASVDALLFVARRLEAEGVALLLAGRYEDEHPLLTSGLPALTVSGLAAGDATALLAERIPGPVAPAVRDTLVTHTGGNPLTLIELAERLDASQLAGRTPLPDPLPVSARVEETFLGQVRQLPADTQLALLVAATEEAGDLAVVLAASTRLELGAAALDPAETSGLIGVSTAGVRFRHPAIRSAVYAGASFTQRRLVHQALADVLTRPVDADRRAWHLAAATIGPDAGVADELARSAERARHRSGFASAASTLERAAQLTSDAGQRAERLIAAADAAWRAGQADRALTLLASVEPGTAEPTALAEAELLQGLIQLRHGIAADAYRTLIAGAERAIEHAPATAAIMLGHAAEASSSAGDLGGVLTAARMADALPPDGTVLPIVRDFLGGVADVLEGDSTAGGARLGRAMAAADRLADPYQDLGTWWAAAALYAGDPSISMRLVDRSAAVARQSGSVAALPSLLDFQVMFEMSWGRLAVANSLADEGLRLATEIGQPMAACGHLSNLARLAALRGQDEECRVRAGEGLALASEHGLGLYAGRAEWSIALSDLSAGRAAEALERLQRLSDPAGRQWHPMVSFYSLPDLIEAAVRLGDSAAASRAFAQLEPFLGRATNAPPRAMLAHCRALATTDEDEALGHFAESMRLHAERPAPMIMARTALLYGEALRRARRRSEAREPLRAALEAFERMGMAPWADRARTELRATGETTQQQGPSALDTLTPQELRIARLVAAGSSNSEVATQLFLSRRTVEYHLYKIFPKLAITSRLELVRLVMASPELSPAVAS